MDKAWNMEFLFWLFCNVSKVKEETLELMESLYTLFIAECSVSGNLIGGSEGI